MATHGISDFSNGRLYAQMCQPQTFENELSVPSDKNYA